MRAIWLLAPLLLLACDRKDAPRVPATPPASASATAPAAAGQEWVFLTDAFMAGREPARFGARLVARNARYDLMLDTAAGSDPGGAPRWIPVRTFDLGTVSDSESVTAGCGLAGKRPDSYTVAVIAAGDVEYPRVIRAWRVAVPELTIRPIPADSVECVNEID